MCTTFKLHNPEQVTLSQNYDFYYGHGLILVNKQGIHKVALCNSLNKENIYDSTLKTPRWISKYGSITFNQFAREIPTCGVNEKGLAIASMWHDTQKFNKSQTDNSITELQWIQYQLDCYSTVDEVIENLHSLDLRIEIYPMHYSVCDKTGNSAIVEISNGKLHAFRSFKHHACSNAGIEESIEYAKKFEGENAEDININEPILDRAAKALCMTKDFDETPNKSNPVDYSFSILDAVSLSVGFKALFKWIGKGIPPSQTFWQIVFDLSNMEIHFKTKANRTIRSIDILEFDYSNKSEVKVLDIEESIEDNVTNMFHSYSRLDNERIVKQSFKPMKDVIPESEQEDLIEFPDLLKIVDT